MQEQNLTQYCRKLEQALTDVVSHINWSLAASTDSHLIRTRTDEISALSQEICKRRAEGKDIEFKETS